MFNVDPVDPSQVDGPLKRFANGIVTACAAVPSGIVATLLGAIFVICDWKQEIQDIFQRDFDVYLPTPSILSAIIGIILVIIILEQLYRKRRGIITGKPVLVMAKGSPLRSWVSVAFFACLLLTVVVPAVFWYKHYHTLHVDRTFVIFIDRFNITGWEESDLNTPVKRALERAMSRVFTRGEFKVIFLDAPKGIMDHKERLEWACASGAMMTIYATGSKESIQPHLEPCSKRVPRLAVFGDDTVDTRVDLPTASYRSRLFSRYAFLEPQMAQRLCVIEVLTPERVEYLASLAMGLICLYEDIPGMTRADLLQAANRFFTQALALGKSETCDLNYCEALLYCGVTKIDLSQTVGDTTLGSTLLNEADSALQGALVIRPDFPEAWYSLGVIGMLKGRDAFAVFVFDRLADAVASDTSAAGKSLWADACVRSGVARGRLGRNDDEIEIYDGLVRRFGDATEVALKAQVAAALYNKGISLSLSGRRDDGIAIYDEVVRRFGGAPEAALRETVASALYNKALTLGQLGRTADEISVYDEIVHLFGDAQETDLIKLVASALVNKGITLSRLQRHADEIAVYDEVVRRFGDSPEASIKEQVAKALINKGVALAQLGRCNDGLAVYGEVVRRFGDAPEPALEERVATSLFNKAVILGQLGRSDEAIAIYDQVIHRFGDAADVALKVRVAMALFNKGVALGQLGRNEDEIAIQAEVVRRFGDATDVALKVQVASALLNKGYRLGLLGRSDDEIAACDELIHRYSSATEAELKEYVALALINKGLSLNRVGRKELATIAYCQAWMRRESLDDEALSRIRKELQLLGRSPETCE